MKKTERNTKGLLKNNKKVTTKWSLFYYFVSILTFILLIEL
jgi:hypothetical protein